MLESNLTPRQFTLGQNYPNTVRPSSPVAKGTKIPLQLALANKVELSVFNLLGHKVATVFSGYLPEGKYEITFDGYGLPVGIYFYKLEVHG